MKKLLSLFICLSIIFCSVFSLACKNPNATQEGVKTVTIKVDYGSLQRKTDSYSLKTDGYYVLNAMKKCSELYADFSYDGSDSGYGFFVETINGVTASWAKNNSYWAFYVNGDYASYGVSQQAIADGDIILFVYTIG